MIFLMKKVLLKRCETIGIKAEVTELPEGYNSRRIYKSIRKIK